LLTELNSAVVKDLDSFELPVPTFILEVSSSSVGWCHPRIVITLTLSLLLDYIR